MYKGTYCIPKLVANKGSLMLRPVVMLICVGTSVVVVFGMHMKFLDECRSTLSRCGNTCNYEIGIGLLYSYRFMSGHWGVGRERGWSA